MVPADVIDFPIPPSAFTRGYRRALATGIDPLDQLDPVNECRHCGHIPCHCAVIAARAMTEADLLMAVINGEDVSAEVQRRCDLLGEQAA